MTSAPTNDTTTSTTKNVRTERILVLYGSQTGNSEYAAKAFCDQIRTKVSPDVLSKYYNTSSSNSDETVIIEPIHMQLDDFLEIEHCAWTRLFIIFVSSYGVGQAPLGGYRFRELCDAWIANNDNTNVLEGTYYAMCGLGDSKYTTYFNNPTAIDTALQKVGSKRIGPLGKADASGTGPNQQSTVIDEWINNIWSELAPIIVTKPQVTKEQLQTMQTVTLKLCQQINPDLNPKTAFKRSTKGKQQQLLHQSSNPFSSVFELLFTSETSFYYGLFVGLIAVFVYYSQTSS